MHHSSRGAEVAVRPLADIVDQRSTFIVRRQKEMLGTYLGNFVPQGDLPGILLIVLYRRFFITVRIPHHVTRRTRVLFLSVSPIYFFMRTRVISRGARTRGGGRSHLVRLCLVESTVQQRAVNDPT